MLRPTKLIDTNIDTNKFKEIFAEYYSFFKSIDSVNILELLPKNIDLNSTPNTYPIDPLSFILNMSSKINSVYTSHELKKNGQYHTENFSVINLILDNTMDFDTDSVINKKILEPSCGTGLFVLTIIKRLYDKGYSKESLINFVNNNLVGFDISPEMVYFTKLNILCLMSYLFDSYNIIFELDLKIFVSDTTHKPKLNTEQLELFDSKLNFTESKEARDIKINSTLKESHKFDYIVGNPPYVTLYGRRDMKKTEELRNYYIDNYDFVPLTVKNGKFNLTMFFFEQALTWVKEHGYISFIVDTSLFESAYKDLRKYILENSKIKYLITDLSVFKNIGSGQVIITLQKSSNFNDNLKNEVSVIKYKTDEKHMILQNKWYEAEEYKFLVIDSRAIEILTKIDQKSVELLSVFPKKSLRTCTMMLSMEDRFTHINKIDTSNELMPYYVGSKSLKSKFGKLSFKKYFEYNRDLQNKINDDLNEELTKQGIKNKKRIGLGDLEVYKSPKIFIRQSATSLIATLSFDMAAANNSLYCLSESKNDQSSIKKLKITCAQLNSTILTFYALSKRIIRTSNGKQPQIKVSDLKKIRLTFNDEIVKQLLDVTDQILLETIEAPIGIEIIDNILFDYYDITNNEKEFILEYVNSH